MISRSRLATYNFIIAGLSLNSHVTIRIIREYAPLLMLQAISAGKERSIGSCSIGGSLHLLPKIIPSFLNCFFVCGAKSEHEVRWLALLRLLSLLRWKFLIVRASSTDFGWYELSFFCLFSFLLLFLREEEILSAAGTGHDRFIIVIDGFI
jgi:hypothetical protein